MRLWLISAKGMLLLLRVWVLPMLRERGIDERLCLTDVVRRIEQFLQTLLGEMRADRFVRGEHVEERLTARDRRLRRAFDELVGVEPADGVAEREHDGFAE